MKRLIAIIAILAFFAQGIGHAYWQDEQTLRPMMLASSDKGRALLYKLDMEAVAETIWPDVYRYKNIVRIGSVNLPIIYTKHYVILGKLLFLNREGWESKKGSLMKYRGNVIVANLSLRKNGNGSLLDFENGDPHAHTPLAILMMQAAPYAIRDRVVLDAGSGRDAVLAVVAYRLGARKVFGVEREPSLVADSRKFVEEYNGISEDSLRIIRADFDNIEQLSETEYIDTVIAVIQPNSIYRSDRFFGSYHELLSEKIKPSWYLMCGINSASRWTLLTAAWMQKAGWHVVSTGTMYLGTALLLQPNKFLPATTLEKPLAFASIDSAA